MNEDEFSMWLIHPVTQFVFAAIRNAQTQEKAEWMRVSWDAGNANPAYLSELRTRADALGELVDNDFEKWSEWHG